jgi:4-hydroxythreonine-4-phosphate dehydrogenase
VYVQADDFSGAAEVGYCFVQHGLSAQVSLGTAVLPGTHDGGASPAGPVTDVVVTDTHSRGLPEAAAGALVAEAFSSPVASGAQVAFKKIDSLWRGNVRAEIAALTGLGFHAVVAGALPQLQRSVIDGKPLVAGTPLAETELWQAELAAPPADIPSLLRPEAAASVQTLDLAAVRSGSLPATLAGLLESDRPALVVADGETVQDLENVVDALLELGFSAGGRRVVLVGTGGTADVLAQRIAAHSARNALCGARAVATGEVLLVGT